MYCNAFVLYMLTSKNPYFDDIIFYRKALVLFVHLKFDYWRLNIISVKANFLLDYTYKLILTVNCINICRIGIDPYISSGSAQSDSSCSTPPSSLASHLSHLSLPTSTAPSVSAGGLGMHHAELPSAATVLGAWANDTQDSPTWFRKASPKTDTGN